MSALNYINKTAALCSVCTKLYLHCVALDFYNQDINKRQQSICRWTLAHNEDIYLSPLRDEPVLLDQTAYEEVQAATHTGQSSVSSGSYPRTICVIGDVRALCALELHDRACVARSHRVVSQVAQFVVGPRPNDHAIPSLSHYAKPFAFAVVTFDLRHNDDMS